MSPKFPFKGLAVAFACSAFAATTGVTAQGDIAAWEGTWSCRSELSSGADQLFPSRSAIEVQTIRPDGSIISSYWMVNLGSDSASAVVGHSRAGGVVTASNPTLDYSLAPVSSVGPYSVRGLCVGDSGRQASGRTVYEHAQCTRAILVNDQVFWGEHADCSRTVTPSLR